MSSVDVNVKIVKNDVRMSRALPSESKARSLETQSVDLLVS